MGCDYVGVELTSSHSLVDLRVEKNILSRSSTKCYHNMCKRRKHIVLEQKQK